MISTLRTLFRASAAEAEEAVIDANGKTLLAQHLRDAKHDVGRARQMCARLMAQKSAEERRIESLTQEIARREEQVHEALTADQGALAEDLADRIVALEDQRENAHRMSKDLDCRIDQLRGSLSQADRRIATLAADLRTARSRSMFDHALDRTADTPCMSSLDQAEEMAARVNDRSACTEDLRNAMTQLRTESDDLDARVAERGLNSQNDARRKAILARLKSETPLNKDA